MSQPDLNDLYFFAQVVERGGFAAAGRALGVPKSRLSRRVALLEGQLGVRLLQRTTRQLALTEVGQRVYRHSQAMSTEAVAAQEVALTVQQKPRGRIRVSCPISVAQSLLSPILPEFMLKYPEVELQLDVTNRRVDLIEEGLDVALRVRTETLEDSTLVVRRLSTTLVLMVASPELLAQHGTPQEPADLARLPALGMVPYDGRYVWPLLAKDGTRVSIMYTPRLISDDLVVLRDAALAGVGAAWLPAYMCCEGIRSGRLVHLLPDWSFPTGQFHAVYPTRRGLMPAVRAFVDFLAERIPQQAAEIGVDGRI